jgi:hypothetical protein
LPSGPAKRYGPKSRRAYHRILSGLKRQKVLRRKIRFLTLTSSPASNWDQLNAHWQTLRKRIMRKWGIKLDYWKVKTDEGYGVLHILFTGPYIPQSWLSAQWDQIHGAEIVDIRAMRGEKRLTRYLIGQYLAGQEEDQVIDGKWVRRIYTRQSWSWDWCFRGFVGIWKRIVAKSSSLTGALRVWASMLRARDPIGWLGGQGPVRLRGIMATVPLA